MVGGSHAERLGSDQLTHKNDFPNAEGTIGLRAAQMLCKVSLVALGCAIFVEPAAAQETAATQPPEENSTLELTTAQTLTARLSPLSTARAGARLRLAVNVDRLHFFDGETEHAIT